MKFNEIHLDRSLTIALPPINIHELKCCIHEQISRLAENSSYDHLPSVALALGVTRLEVN